MTRHINIVLPLFIFVLLTIPTLVFGAAPAKYTSLVDVPFLPDTNTLTTQGYVNALYALSISVAGLLAVLKIIYAGVQYMLSEIVTDKAQAKKDIQGAILGLLIIITAVTILNEINPNLKELNFLRNASSFNDSYTPNQSTQPMQIKTTDVAAWNKYQQNCQAKNRTADRKILSGGKTQLTCNQKDTHYYLQNGDKFKTCGTRDAATCKKEVCTSGTVITSGVKASKSGLNRNTFISKPGQPACISNGNNGSITTEATAPDSTNVPLNMYPGDEPYELSTREHSLKKCTTNAQVCQNTICANGTIVTQGVKINGGSVQFQDTPMCIK